MATQTYYVQPAPPRPPAGSCGMAPGNMAGWWIFVLILIILIILIVALASGGSAASANQQKCLPCNGQQAYYAGANGNGGQKTTA